MQRAFSHGPSPCRTSLEVLVLQISIQLLHSLSDFLDLKHRILPQDEYEAKWYNWCDGFNQAATLLLKRNADETDKANR